MSEIEYKVGQIVEFVENYGPFKKGELSIIESFDQEEQDELCIATVLGLYDKSKKASPFLTRFKPKTRVQIASMNSNTGKSIGVPTHYDYIIQPWEYMSNVMSPEEFRGYLRGNVIKYISRYTKKDGIRDLEKAKNYLVQLIKHEEGMIDG